MQAASLKKLVLLGPLALAGCYSPYGYQSPYAPGPYGQPYQPAYPANPVYTVPPGQPYVPGGTTPGMTPGNGSPTPITPPSTYDSGGGSSPSGGNAPTFSTDPPRGTVPNPGDDLNNGGPAASNPGGLQPTSSQALESPFEQQESNLNNAPARQVRPAQMSDETADPFELPERGAANGEPGMLQNVNYVAPPEGLNPYGRDTKHANPEWLRGVLDFDQKTKTWQITYAASPDPRDRNGGSLTLAKHADLALSRSGDIVLIEGAIDASHTDGRGKPLYMIDKVTPLATH